MGKKSRLKKERRDGGADAPFSAAQLVDRYLLEIKAPGLVERAEFWDWLDARHPADSLHLSDVMDGVINDDRWGARCASLRLSLDHQFGFSGRLYRPLLRALAYRLQGREIDSVLDVGCENALVGCFVTSLSPGACLTGFDIESRAVAAAQELAALLDLSATLAVGDITADWPVAGTHDVVLSMRSLFGNALGARRTDADDPQLDAVLRRVRASLADGGLYVAFERLTDAGRSNEFVVAAAAHGLSLDRERSTVLVVEEIPGKAERIPLLLFSPSDDAEPSPASFLQGLHDEAERRARR